MPAMFAALESRINGVISNRLANATASIAGAAAIAGIFERRSGDALSYVAGTRPTLSCAESLAPNVAEGDAISISNAAGDVLFDGDVARVENDGNGWLVLSLREMA